MSVNQLLVADLILMRNKSVFACCKTMPLRKDIADGQENIAVAVENLFDDAFPDEFQYTSTSVPSAQCDLDLFQVQYAGCSCQSEKHCSSSTCLCIGTKSLGIPHYSHHGTILPTIVGDETQQPPVFECNTCCTCNASTCRNRLVQLGITHQLAVFRTRDTGWGLKTLEPIPGGSFVVEYAGEIVDHREARDRTLAQSCNDKNYIHVLREHVGGGGAIVTYVDPTEVGNAGRFVNHSCEPNLVMIPVRIDNAVPRLSLFARRDIDAQEELSFHYGGGGLADVGSGSAAVRKPCLCGAVSCAGVLPFDHTIF